MGSLAKIKVLIVDDSAAVRQLLTEILSSDHDIEVVGSAADPYVAARRIEVLAPDVIVLDVEMPRMDGITFLEKLMLQHPMPVVMCSSLTSAGSQTALLALEKGAVEIIEKPKVDTLRHLQESRTTICDVIKSAAATRRRPASPQPETPAAAPHMIVPPKLSPDVILPGPIPGSQLATTEKVIVVGASTGGTEALRIFLGQMPVDCPGILVVQHMPERFTTTFAQRLDGLCAIEVREAAHGDLVQRGRALIAPGNRHMLLKRTGIHYHVELHDGPLVSRHRPSVNVLFRSAARYGGPNVVGVIMTGMGDDGALGMSELRQQGAFNFAQDEASCIVFGMPGEAVRLGAVHRIVPLDSLATEITRHCKVGP